MAARRASAAGWVVYRTPFQFLNDWLQAYSSRLVCVAVRTDRNWSGGIVVSVTVLVLLAGCGGVSDPSVTQSETTVVDSETVTPTEQTVSETTLPPGVTRTGVDNVSRLVMAHESAVIRQGGRVETTTNATLGSQQVRSVTTRTATQNLTAVRYEASVTTDTATGGTDQDVLIYANETSVSQRVTVDGNVTMDTVRNRSDVFETALTSFATARNPIRGTLRRGNFSVAGVERTDGQTIITLRADEYTGGQLVATGNVSSYSATVRVTADGLVRSATERITPVNDTAFGGYRFDYQYQPVESPPQPPTTDNTTAGRIAHPG